LRRAVHAIDPAIPVLMMSGYSHEAITRLASREVLGPMIEKPFTVDGLLQKIEDVLDGAPSAAARRRAPQSP
jgi:DNA-binding NtrC family response regulator